ncbi:unnamed protein product [Rotaria sp. Silwood1]|nr:unnamed protein product [Rotaria sp. Silwood1]CAF0971483.1 unnamed protein product [Rotaria sp. Silwood1]CAF3415244.1 unnamed protein product [Rotaria sp. Silwood1]CAF3415655.1 unnamed protein product [Rotaria sp. Silwood1]CAF4713424.1 unnamed protein product [Rotaria sp. Silwood1]
MLLFNEEAKKLDINDKLLLPNSTHLLKRRTSLLEKSRDWARRLIALHRPRRNTVSNEKIRETCSELNKNQETKKIASHEFLHNYQKSFDEDGYLSPMEIKAKLDNLTQENTHYRHRHQSSQSKLSTNSEHFLLNSNSSSNVSQRIYRYHDPNIQTLSSQSTYQQQKQLPKTSFLSEFQKSLSVFDYIDFDVPKETIKQNDDEEQQEEEEDSLESLKYLFNDDHKKQQGNFSRRILRRSTNASSISTDSGYSDIPTLSSKLIPVHLISCTLIPVNVTTPNSTNICCIPCTCRPSLSSTCLLNQYEQKYSSNSCHTHFSQQPLSHIDKTENFINNVCPCNNKYYSTMAICPSLSVPLTMPSRSVTKLDDLKEEYYTKKNEQKRHLKTRRASFMRSPNVTDDFKSISRWYRPYLEREAVCDVLQQADYGAFVLRDSTTHPDCYALSIKVPKFTHESNIVHYLIEKTLVNNNPIYRIRGTIKQFPTLLSLLIHHSVMPEILPITLNLNESFTV